MRSLSALAVAVCGLAVLVSVAGSVARAATTNALIVADAYVDTSHPTTNYGSSATLRVDASPAQRSFLRFSLAGISGTVTNATLRVWANNTHPAGYDVYGVADNTWAETGTNGVKDSNAPALGAQVGSSAPVTAVGWTNVDVTSLVASASGSVSLALKTTSNTALAMSSRSGAHPPELVVDATGSSPPPSCQTSTNGTAYSVTVCVVEPTGGTVSGAASVTATASATSLNGNPLPSTRVRFCVDDTGCTGAADGYVLSDFTGSPYGFTLPSARWVDGTHTLTARPWMGDSFLGQPTPAITLTFANGVTSPPVNGNTFTPTGGTTPPAGQPLVVAAVGDGAAGESNAASVAGQIGTWNPNLVLYLGDVYEKGAPTEFSNYYDGGSSYGQFRSITDPTVGNHEYGYDNQASGYFDYWNNAPHYYSFNAGDWHFVSLDSTSQYAATAGWAAQYQWLQQDLAADSAACTLVYYHHPYYNIGPEGATQRMSDIWSLLVSHGGVLVLNGHDHDYQRYEALDWTGQPNPNGVTEIVVGTGGHGIQQPTGSVSGPQPVLSDFATGDFGALKLQLNPTSADVSFTTISGAQIDSTNIPCNPPPTDTTPPTAPTNLTANAPSADRVTLTWGASADNLGVTGYDIFRDGSPLTSVGPQTSYNDATVRATTTYTYVVKAHDAAGNPSDPSNTASVTTPAGLTPPLFADDFETGTMGKWTNTGLTVQSGEVYAGTFAARQTSTGAATWAWAPITPQASLYSRVRFKVISQGANNAYLLKLRTGSGTSIGGLYRATNGTIAFRNDAGAVTVTSPQVATSGAWHSLELHATVGSSGLIEVWLDGNKITQLSSTQNLGTAAIGRIQIGDNSGARTYDIAFDDSVADSSFIGS